MFYCLNIFILRALDSIFKEVKFMRLISEAWELLCYGLCPRDHRFIGFRMPRYPHPRLCNGACPIASWKSEMYTSGTYKYSRPDHCLQIFWLYFSAAHKVVVMRFGCLQCAVALCDARSLIESALHHLRKMEGGNTVGILWVSETIARRLTKISIFCSLEFLISHNLKWIWFVWYCRCTVYCSLVMNTLGRALLYPDIIVKTQDVDHGSTANSIHFHC